MRDKWSEATEQSVWIAVMRDFRDLVKEMEDAGLV